MKRYYLSPIKNNPIPEIIENYRKICIFYVKVNLIFIATLISIATLFKSDRIEVFRFIEENNKTVILIFCLIIYGLILDLLLFYYWEESKLKNNLNKRIINWAKLGIYIQIFINMIVMVNLTFYGIGYISTFTPAYDEG
jgi:hypothetical protein